MTTPTRKSRKGFTLIELLTVIAIIGILAAVLFPGVQGVMLSAKKNSALNKIRSIGQGYMNWAGGTKSIATGAWASGLNQTTSISGYAAILAYGATMNTGSLWFADGDPAVDLITQIPPNVVTISGTTVSINTQFATAMSQGKASWDLYSPTSRSLVGNVTTPLGWSRGLTIAGTWPAAGTGPQDSVWGTTGGHICYGDGHVSWVSDTTVAGQNFFTNTAGAPSASYKDAIPTTASLLTQN